MLTKFRHYHHQTYSLKQFHQVSIPLRTLAILPMPHLIVYPNLTVIIASWNHQSCMSYSKIFLLWQYLKSGRNTQICLLCTIINTSSGDIVLPETQHLGEMKLLSSIGDPLKPSALNEVTYDINSDHC